MDQQDIRKLILFRINERRFGIDVRRVKKIIKEKGDLQITQISGAPPYILGIAEVEITQGEKTIITFIDLKKIIDMRKLETNEEKESDKIKEGEQIDVKKKEEEREKEEKEIEEKKEKERRIFMIVLGQTRKEFFGVLTDEVEGIEEFDNINAKLYPPPDIKNIKEFFEGIIIVYEGKNKGERIFILNPNKLAEFIK
jgi:chemotaxis signal transduction protein